MASPSSPANLPLQLSDHLGRPEFFELLRRSLEIAACPSAGPESWEILEQARESLLRAAANRMLPEALACARGLRSDLRSEGALGFYQLALDTASGCGLARLAVELLDPPHPAMALAMWAKRAKTAAVAGGHPLLAETLDAMVQSQAERRTLRSALDAAQNPAAESDRRSKSL